MPTKRRPSRKNPSRPLRRGVVQAPRSLGEKILPWSTTGSALRLVAETFAAGRPAPQADVRRALYAIRTLRTRYADRELADIERALADRVEPRTNPLRPPARRKAPDAATTARGAFYVVVSTGETDRKGYRVQSIYTLDTESDARGLAAYWRAMDFPAYVTPERPRTSDLLGVSVRHLAVVPALREAARAMRANPSVECSKSKKLDRYRHAEVIHEGETVALDGCFAKGRTPAYEGAWKTGAKKGKRTTVSKRAVRQKASRSPSRVKGVRARKRR